MTSTGLLGDYIARSCRRLLVCMAPRDEGSADASPRATKRAKKVRDDLRDDVPADDPFRGCVSGRSSSGPRESGDYVLMGCMQV